jgi:cell division septal protein FtsQ
MWPFSKRKNDPNTRSRQKPALRIVNRNSFWFKVKNRFTSKKAKVAKHTIDNPLSRKPTTPLLKRKLSFIKNINPKILRITLASIAFLLLSVLVYLGVTLVRNSYFSVGQFTFIGNNALSEEKLLNSLKTYQGQSIFLVSTNQIEQKLWRDNSNILSVTATKIFPNQIFIKITEKEAKIVLVNLNGAYLIDADSKVLDILAQESINYDQAKLELATGFADENSPLIRNIFLQKFITDNKLENLTEVKRQEEITKNFNFDNIPIDQKLKEYNDLKNQIQNELDALTGKIQNKVQISDYNQLPRIIFSNNTKYTNNEVVDKKRLELTLEITRYFSNPATSTKIIGHIRWRGEVLVETTLSNGVTLIFGALKKPSEQLENYEIMLNYLQAQNKNFRQIDLSSSKISVK